MKKVAILFLPVLFVSLSLGVYAERGMVSHDHAVELTAFQAASPANSLELRWRGNDTHTGEITIHRKKAEERSFPGDPVVVLDSGTTSWIDSNIVKGRRYTYQVSALGKAKYSGGDNPYYAFGYIEAGIEAKEIFDYGKVLVLVDSTVFEPLQLELERLVDDMEAEGWAVVLRKAPRAETYDRSKVDITKQIILDEYEKDNNLSTVLLFGRIAVAYSGHEAIDGHDAPGKGPVHLGAWASDLYYGDVQSVGWSDNSVNETTSAREENKNIPGDGKFDLDRLSHISGATEIAVGRVDLYNMPLFHQDGETGKDGEIRLLRQYLEKNHAWRTGQWDDIPYSGIVGDNFKTQPEGFASAGWRNIASIVGFENLKEVEKDSFIVTLNRETHLFAYGTGPGGYKSCAGIGRTNDFADNQIQAPFTFLFGSYFGDFDHKDNILRAPLCSMPYGLTCCWDGRPHWFFHELVMGRPFSKSILTSINNTGGVYKANAIRYGTGFAIYSLGAGGRHMNFMGDPTLRLDSYRSIPAEDLTAEQEENLVKLDWTGPPTDNIYHFNVFRRHGEEESWVKINVEPVQSEYFVDSTNTTPGTAIYQVRTATLVDCNTGSYFQTGRAAETQIEFDYTPKPEITFSKGLIDFGEVTVEGENTQILRVSNTGKGDLTVEGFDFEESIADVFSSNIPELPVIIEEGKSIIVRIVFAPDEEKQYEGDILITSDAVNTDNPVTKVRLRGSGIGSGVYDIPAEKITLSPNPADDVIRIESDLILGTIEIFDIGGRKLMQTRNTDIDISELPAGAYFIVVYSGDRKAALKFTKK